MKIETNWAPESCTLPTAEQPLRIAEFSDLFAASLQSADRSCPTLLRLTLLASARQEAVRLTDAESSCCSFFTFTVSEPVADQVHVDVEVPAAHVVVLDALAEQAIAARRLP
jgi:Ran GTPase-activating protein (RanGAP) involved in mRNA processing and transport